MLTKEKKRDIEGDLRHAAKLEQLEVHFQPLLNAREAMVGFEALMRWKHPIMGYVPPGEFIPLAEKSGLITELGEWVLKTACSEGVRWQREHLRKLRGPGVRSRSTISEPAIRLCVISRNCQPVQSNWTTPLSRERQVENRACSVQSWNWRMRWAAIICKVITTAGR